MAFNYKKFFNSDRVGTRFLLTFTFNLLRVGFAFMSGIVLARFLGVENYGNFTFLLASFLAFKNLIDLGTSQAFYTFISQRKQPFSFYLYYAAWVCFQFMAPLLIIGLLFPDDWLRVIWLGQSRWAVLIAFVAAFMQMQVWTSVVSIAESERKTGPIQLANCLLAAVHLAILLLFIFADFLSVITVFAAQAAEYLIATVIALRLLRRGLTEPSPEGGFRPADMAKDYFQYCSPLALLFLLGFAAKYEDRWLLQYFGGSSEQAFYGVSERLSTIILFTTSAILRVLWKESAEAHFQGDTARIRDLFSKTIVFAMSLSSVVIGFLLPWHNELLVSLFGADYSTASTTFAIILFLPLYQSLGQISGTILIAINMVRHYSLVNYIYLVVNMIVTYFVLATPDTLVPGMGLGSAGLAIKGVLLQIVVVNFYLSLIARKIQWRLALLNQLMTYIFFILLGYASCFVASRLISSHYLIAQMLVSGLMYGGIILGLGWFGEDRLTKMRIELPLRQTVARFKAMFREH